MCILSKHVGYQTKVFVIFGVLLKEERKPKRKRKTREPIKRKTPIRRERRTIKEKIDLHFKYEYICIFTMLLGILNIMVIYSCIFSVPLFLIIQISSLMDRFNKILNKMEHDYEQLPRRSERLRLKRQHESDYQLNSRPARTYLR